MQTRLLSIPQTKQIAGRAGRFRTSLQDNQAAETSRTDSNKPAPPMDPPAIDIPPEDSVVQRRHEVTQHSSESGLSIASDPPPVASSRPQPPQQDAQNVGLVTTLDREDFEAVANALGDSAPPITQAGIMPPDDIIIRFSSYFPPGTPFSYVLVRLHEIAQVSKRFFICALKDQLQLADTIHEVEDLTVQERMTFCKAPLSLRQHSGSDRMREFVLQCARAISEQHGGGILELTALDLDILDEEVVADRKFLGRAELLHKMLVGYLWLSFRFPGVFANRPLAIHVKEMVEKVIEESLSMFSFHSKEGRKLRQQERERELMETLQRDLLGREEDGELDDEEHELRDEKTLLEEHQQDQA